MSAPSRAPYQAFFAIPITARGRSLYPLTQQPSQQWFFVTGASLVIAVLVGTG